MKKLIFAFVSFALFFVLGCENATQAICDGKCVEDLNLDGKSQVNLGNFELLPNAPEGILSIVEDTTKGSLRITVNSYENLCWIYNLSKIYTGSSGMTSHPGPMYDTEPLTDFSVSYKSFLYENPGIHLEFRIYSEIIQYSFQKQDTSLDEWLSNLNIKRK